MGLFDRFSKPPPIVRDRWNGYTYRFGEDERCIVSFDVAACDPAEQRPSQLRRVIGFSARDQIGPTGMPSRAAMARLSAIEDALVAELQARRVRAWLIGKQVYRGLRELLFQVDDLDKFASAHAVVEGKLGGTKLVEHADWTFFNDKIRPDAQARNQIGNREVIAALKRAGSVLSVAHNLDHTFVGPAAALDAIAAGLAARGSMASPGRRVATLSSVDGARGSRSARRSDHGSPRAGRCPRRQVRRLGRRGGNGLSGCAGLIDVERHHAAAARAVTVG